MQKDKNRNIFFISKWANWQKYRLEVLTKYAQTYDCKVEILTTGIIKDYLKGNDLVIYKLFKSIFPQNFKFSFMPGILWHIIKNRPNTILCVNNSTQLTEYLAIFLCKILGIRFVWWTHGYDHGISKLPNFIKYLKKKYVLFFLNKGNSIIVFADKGRDYLISNGISAEKIFVAPNTLDTSKLIEQKQTLEKQMSYKDILVELNLKKDDKVILFSGQLNKNKKVENAIYATELVAKNIPSIKLVMIGGGSEYNRLTDLARQHIPSNSIFLGDLFDDLILAKWFSVAQLYIMPGYVGLAIIHAFSYGLPFITEKLSYHSPEIHFLKNEVNGYMVAENNIEELAEKISYLLVNDKVRLSFSHNAFSVAQNEGNIENMIDKMNKALTIKM